MGHAFQPAEKSASRSSGGTSNHGLAIMRKLAPENQGLLQRKTDRCACGGSCPRCQAKSNLKIGAPDDAYEREADAVVNQPGDVYEQEADRVAETVTDLRTPPMEEEALQTKGVLGPAPRVPPVAGEVLRSLGRPLDQASRTFMEFRFGHDFSKVRVHTDAKAAESAQMVNALAYTVGQDIVFGAGQYNPHSLVGRALLAHELTHTIQQRTASSDATPRIQFARVTSGGFGKALEDADLFPTYTKADLESSRNKGEADWSLKPPPTALYKIPDKAVQLLSRSKTFMALARTLDSHYVARHESSVFNPVLGPEGRINAGDPGMLKSMIGKRELMIMRGQGSFIPVESPDNRFSSDVISVDDTNISSFIQTLAHEATHAANFVGASGPPPETLIDEVNAAIQEEIKTRKSEAKILSEIPDKEVQAGFEPVGSQMPSEVQREIPPAFGLTYLELAYFGRRLQDAQAAEQLSDETARTMREDVDSYLEGTASSFDLYDEYANVWFDRQTAKLDWKEFRKQHPDPGYPDPDYMNAKEDRLQKHASRFFEGRISYLPLYEDIYEP